MKIYSKTKRFDLDLTYYLKNQLVKSRIHFLFKDNMLPIEKSRFQERFELTNSFFGLKKIALLGRESSFKKLLKLISEQKHQNQIRNRHNIQNG